jgi:hypothetical protein
MSELKLRPPVPKHAVSPVQNGSIQVADLKVSATWTQEERQQGKGFNAEGAEEAQRSQRSTQRQNEKIG